jgi:preprotein translocase subunit YajC
MVEFIASANAQEAAAAAGEPSLLSGILPLILMLVVFYFLLIRPQQKKIGEHKKMVDALRRGDKVVTTGGIYATISKVDEDSLQAEIADAVKIKLDKNSVAVVLTRKEPADSKTEKKK